MKDIKQDYTSYCYNSPIITAFPLPGQATLNETVGSSNHCAVIVSIGISKITIFDHVQSVVPKSGTSRLSATFVSRKVRPNSIEGMVKKLKEQAAIRPLSTIIIGCPRMRYKVPPEPCPFNQFYKWYIVVESRKCIIHLLPWPLHPNKAVVPLPFGGILSSSRYSHH